jgi:nucleoside-diphosphate-sugar epimerase
MKTILVTGSNGFLGEEIVNAYSKDYKIIALDRDDQLLESSKKNIIIVKADINSVSSLEYIFKQYKINIIIHCAAEILDEYNESNVWKTNYFGTLNLLNFCERFNIDKFIFTSTFSIFEKNYTSSIDEEELPSAIVDYGKSKYAAENLILRHNFNGDVVIFRCPVIIGKKRLDKLCLLFEMVRQNLSIRFIGDGSNKIHFIYVNDLMEAISLSFNLKGKYIFNIGSDNVKSLEVVFKYLINNSNSKSKIKKFPKFLGVVLLKFMYFLKIISFGPYHQRMLTSNLILNTNRIKKTLNWQPLYSNEEMLLECYKHYLSTINCSKDSSSSKKIPNLKILKILTFLENFSVIK